MPQWTPVREIDFSNKSDKVAHDRMVSLVEQMLALHKRLAAARTPQEKTALERQIACKLQQGRSLAVPANGALDTAAFAVPAHPFVRQPRLAGQCKESVTRSVASG